MATREDRGQRSGKTVGVRDLRQNLSRHLQRVAAGETLEIASHGHPVALLSPLPPGVDAVELMVRSERARPPQRL